jgi:hypothetical protein
VFRKPNGRKEAIVATANDTRSDRRERFSSCHDLLLGQHLQINMTMIRNEGKRSGTEIDMGTLRAMPLSSRQNEMLAVSAL